MIVYQQLENYVIAPRVTSRTMDIHPAVSIGAVIAALWKWRNPPQAETYTVPVGSGFVAGQGLVAALLVIIVAAVS